MKSKDALRDLTVRGELIERSYTIYKNERYQVNRRYQRKLIWNLKEKQNFIDSLINGFPIPIILLVEIGENFEILDGMQRLNAVFSFVENDYPLADGRYFDLDAIASIRPLIVSGDLVQKEPRLDLEACAKFASYQLPVSIYENENHAEIDEIFRRINSGGRQLSRQELRAAGATSAFADAVRKIAANIRGDSSQKDLLSLNAMKKISITSRDLDYGIDSDTIFWVRHQILTREQVRQSLDEQLIADVLAYILSDEPISSRAEHLDDYFYPFARDEAAEKRFNGIDTAIRNKTKEVAIQEFQEIHDIITLVLDDHQIELGRLLFDGQSPGRVPRYYQVIFIAIFKIMMENGKILRNKELFIKKLRGAAKHISIQEGGRWGADAKEKAIDSFTGYIQSCFRKGNKTDSSKIFWVSQLENLLNQSTTEQALYDFKQGFFQLSSPPAFDEDCWVRILETAVAMANTDKRSVGYIIIGVADKPITADRIRKLFSVESREINGFFVCGIKHEMDLMKLTAEQFFQHIVRKIETSTISFDLRSSLSKQLKIINYHDKVVCIIEVRPQENVSTLDGHYWVRRGPSTFEVEGHEIASLVRQFLGAA